MAGRATGVRMRRWVGLAALAGVYVLVRVVASHWSFMTLLDYDEAVTGCAAMNILKGHLQVFQWGQVYTGSLEALLAAPWFAFLPPSALAMRASMFLVGAVGALALVGVGRMAGGRLEGWLAGVYWAVPPIFLVVITYYVTGGHLEAVVALAVELYMLCRLGFDPPRRAVAWAFGAGVVAGVGMWSSLLVVVPMGACVLGLVLARPRILRSWEAAALAGGVVVGLSPVWIWNILNDGLTLRWIMSAAGGDVLANLPGLFARVWIPCLVGTYWDGFTVGDYLPSTARWAVLLGVYLPAFSLALARCPRWVARALRRRPPLADGVDMAVLCLIAGMIAHAHSSYGHLGMTRYAVVLFVPFSVVVGWWLGRLWGWRRWVGAGVTAGLVGFNLATVWLFLAHNPAPARPPLKTLVSRLEEHGPRRGWGHWRVAYPITFYSAQKVICSPFWGWRNYDYLRVVRASTSPGLFTHTRACSPCPHELAQALKVLGVKARRRQIGPWVWWEGVSQHWQPLERRGWRARFFDGSVGEGGLLLDGQLLSYVKGGKGLKWIELDLGRSRVVNGVCLLPPPVPTGLKGGYSQRVRVRLSQDGRSWQTVNQGQSMLGLVWDGRQVYLSRVPVLEVGFEPLKARWVRVEFLSPALPVAEAFIFGPGRYSPSPELRQLKSRAMQALEPYYDDPTGPFVSFLGVPPSYRRARVFWPEVASWAVLAAGRRPLDPFALLWLEELWEQGGLDVGWPMGRWRGVVMGAQGGMRLPESWDRSVIEGKGWVWISPTGWWGKLKDIGVRERRVDDGVAGGWVKVKEGWIYCYNPSWNPPPGAVARAEALMGGGRIEAEVVGSGAGRVVADEAASGARALRLAQGEHFTCRFRRFALRGNYTIRLRARPRTGEGHVSCLVKIRACNSYGPIEVLGEGSWCGCAGEGYTTVAVKVSNPYQPVRLEVEVRCLGRGEMDLDYVELLAEGGRR